MPTHKAEGQEPLSDFRQDITEESIDKATEHVRSRRMPYKVIKVGKPISIDDLKHKSASAGGRKRKPRDIELERLVTEVAAGPESQVWPWTYEPEKPATARQAATKAIKLSELKVYVSARRDMPGVLLFSRTPLRKPRT